MEITAKTTGKVTIVEIPVEELDANNTAEFKRDIAPILQTDTRLVIDFGRVRFIDSSGLGAMLSCLRQVSAKGGDLKLCGMSKQVRATFELVRMDRIFEIFPSQQDAVRAFEVHV